MRRGNHITSQLKRIAPLIAQLPLKSIRLVLMEGVPPSGLAVDWLRCLTGAIQHYDPLILAAQIVIVTDSTNMAARCSKPSY